MKALLVTRWLHWRKHAVSLLFWLFFPPVAAILIVTGVGEVRDDARIPVGIVNLSTSEKAAALVEALEETRLLKVYSLDEMTAKQRLRQHELDSVFVISEDYGQAVRHGERDELLVGYRTGQSLAYVPVKEVILSHVQQVFDRAKTVQVLQGLAADFAGEEDWSRAEIIQTSKTIQKQEDLLQVRLHFANEDQVSAGSKNWLELWAVWACLQMLATFLIFDWVVRERQAGVGMRFVFMKIGYKHYMLGHLLLYALLGLCMDVLTLSVFEFGFSESISVGSLVVYQLFLSVAAFLLAQCFRRPFFYHMTVFALVLLVAVSSGAILPLPGMADMGKWAELWAPLAPFLTGGYMSAWTVIVGLGAVFWYVKKERLYA